MLFDRRPDGVYALEVWPPTMEFAVEFLEAGERTYAPWVHVGDGIVSLSVNNGSASYGLGEYSLLSHTRRGSLGPGSTWEPPG